MGKQRYSKSAKELKEESMSKEERNKYEVGLVQGLVRKQWRSYIDDEFIDRLNNLGGESKVLSKIYKDNFFSWLKAVSGDDWDCRKYGIEDYVNAVKFVSLRLLGNTVLDSYKEVFPDRVMLVEKEYEEDGDSSKLKERLNWLASAYSKGKLVVKILQLTLVPSYIINAPLYDEALQKLADMIRNDEVRGMAKVKACEAILEATKQPEVIEQNVNVNVGGGMIRNEAMDELREVTEKLAATLKMEMEKGKHKLQEVADIELVKKAEEGEVANYAVE
jgi:hypothetical protein